tara:strand:- start:110 stop:265 length:156 start_codon:yes stop_codon:yes gene_type:complete
MTRPLVIDCACRDRWLTPSGHDDGVVFCVRCRARYRVSGDEVYWLDAEPSP